MNIQVQVWTLFDVRGNLGSDSAEGAPGPDTDVFDWEVCPYVTWVPGYLGRPTQALPQQNATTTAELS